MAKKKLNSRNKSAENREFDSAAARKELAKLKKDVVANLDAFKVLALEIAKHDPKHFGQFLDKNLAVRPLKKPGKRSSHDELVTKLLSEFASLLRTAADGERSSVAFLGPPHSYSHLATLEAFGHGVDLVPVRSIAAVFEEVSSGQVHAGVVPIENSTDGRIIDTLERLTQASVKICGEIPLPIHHNLLGVGKREDILEVCSKPQAISQCRQWLSEHLPAAKVTSMSSTTVAAKRAAKNKQVAAIASREAGKEYRLKVLASNIEDNKNNATRFAIIGSKAAERTGDDKTSMMFELSHQPGALADVMMIFKRKGLNLTWIESFPKPGSPHEYLFFVEFQGHQTDLRVRKAIDLLGKKTVRLELLGSYPQRTIDA